MIRKMGIDWVTFEGRRMPYRSKEKGEHYRLIVEATQEKVRQNPEVKKVLLSTGSLILRPDHHQEPGRTTYTNHVSRWCGWNVPPETRDAHRRCDWAHSPG